MNYLLVFIVVISFSNCRGQVEDEVAKKAIKEESYILMKIDSTQQYFLYTVVNQKKEDVLIVVDKNSSQIKGKNIALSKTYSLKTYGYYDVFALDANRCHLVDNQKVWCHIDGIELRFTDGLGNNNIEN